MGQVFSTIGIKKPRISLTSTPAHPQQKKGSGLQHQLDLLETSHWVQTQPAQRLFGGCCLSHTHADSPSLPCLSLRCLQCDNNAVSSFYLGPTDNWPRTSKLDMKHKGVECRHLPFFTGGWWQSWWLQLEDSRFFWCLPCQYSLGKKETLIFFLNVFYLPTTTIPKALYPLDLTSP